MTIRDYINTRLKQWNAKVSDDVVNIAFNLSKINSEQEITDNEISALKVLYRLIPDIIISVPKSVSEGGFSITYDKEAMVSFYNMISERLNLPNQMGGKSTVKDITAKW